MLKNNNDHPLGSASFSNLPGTESFSAKPTLQGCWEKSPLATDLFYGHKSFPFSSFTLEPYKSTPAPHPRWGTSQTGRGSVAPGCWFEN